MKPISSLLLLVVLAISTTADARCVIGLRGKHVFADGDCAIWGLKPCVDLPIAAGAKPDIIETSACKDGEGQCLNNTEIKCGEVGTLVHGKKDSASCKVIITSQKRLKAMSQSRL